MCHHQHLTTHERESILVFIHLKLSIREMARRLKRSPSTITREIKRNRGKYKYSPFDADRRYLKRRKNCGPTRRLADPLLKQSVLELLNKQWSPEQISARMKREGTASVSYNTIYRAINRRVFETERLSPSTLGIKKQLRHHGKHKKKGTSDRRGKMEISHHITERPKEANERSEVGHIEADTIVGHKQSGAIVTMVDRQTRYLYAELVPDLKAATVREAMEKIISQTPEIKTITPDRGKEFSEHKKVTEATGVEFYFPPPRQPGARGTNENTNGLLRQYFPKRKTFAVYTGEEVQQYVERLNQRPRKILNWRSPYEVKNNLVLHLT